MRKNSRRELRAIYKAAEMIQDAEMPREADIMTGYVIGIIAEKYRSGKLTHRTADAIAEMVEAVGEGKRKELIDLIHGREPDETPVLQYEDIRGAAELYSERAAR